ncbi:MAG TPA: GAF domain-containing protein [Solirubrobacteraceae bacterium]|nr:GAF domain-containing protein [Solirubrobacteraceae bacterium]
MDRPALGILDVARGVLEELDLDTVLERVLDAALELSEARYAALGVLDGSQRELSRFIAKGVEEATRAQIGSLPRGRGVLGTVIESHAPLRLADVGRHPRSFGFPPGHPPMRTFLGVPIRVRGVPYGNLYLTEKAGGAEFSAEDEQAVVALAEFAGVAIENARCYTGTRERRDELERAVAALEATTHLATVLGGETDLGVILELVAKRGRALVSARTLLIELAHGSELVVAAGAGEIPDGVVGQRVAVEDTVARQAIQQRRTLRLSEDLNRARFQEQGLGRLGVCASDGIVVPLVFRGGVHGVLLAIDRLEDGPSFTAEDVRLLEAFAATAATAVAMGQAFASERQSQRLAAAEGERRRWARELHDETLQNLSALRVGLARAERSGEPEAVAEAVRGAAQLLEEGIANLRALITDLRPAALDELGVQAAIEALVDRSKRHGIEVDLSVELAFEQRGRATRYLPELETAMYRIVQEALTNAVRHGGAKRALIEIRELPDGVRLLVRDDGCGFDAAAELAGFGLLGMRERADLLGGELLIESAPGGGTTVSAHLPVAQRLGRDVDSPDSAAGPSVAVAR